MAMELKPFAKLMVHLFFIIICILFLLPLVSVIAISLSDTVSLIKQGYSFWPRGFTSEAYVFLLKAPMTLIQSYGVTIMVTLTGCILGLAINALIAYPLSRSNFKYKKAITLFIAVSMFFNGGLVPTYVLISQYLGGKDTLWVMIIPALCVPWYIILLRTFFKGIPFALVESAMIDGAGEWRIVRSIILPLSKPALATVGLFLALGYWNEWYAPLLYINDKDLYPLQYLLYKYMADVQAMANIQQSNLSGLNYSQLPTESIRMAMCVLAAGPMLFIFPLFQKHFVKGLTLGALKG
jgi:putative aldouronate transport system permease protein